MKHSYDFSKDVQEIIAEKMIANEFGIGMDCIRAIIGKSLALIMFFKTPASYGYCNTLLETWTSSP